MKLSIHAVLLAQLYVFILALYALFVVQISMHKRVLQTSFFEVCTHFKIGGYVYTK